jgi:hypothetical protein
MKRRILFLAAITIILSAFPLFSQSPVINELMPANLSTIADEDGEYTDWIEIYNPSGSSINLNGYFLSDDENNNVKWNFPNISIASHSFLIVFASGKDRSNPGEQLHTNFKLKSSGDPVILSNPQGVIINQITPDPIPTDISFGRKPDGDSSWYFFDDPTPGSANNSLGYSGIADHPEFSIDGGPYTGSVSIDLISSVPQSQIFYTNDGSIPTTNSLLYTSSISVSETKVIRAKVFADDLLSSNTVTNTYFINENILLPVISVSTNPENLWDEEFGIYVLGDSAEPDFPYHGANFWQDWEKPIHIEMYEPNGSEAFSIDAGVKIYGGWSRGFDQKSLAIYARDVYNFDKINYQIFPELSYDKFDNFVLRNGGQDWEYTMFRDAMMQYTLFGSELDILAYKPTVVFLNGEYWGIHNIREKINENYLTAHHGVDPGNLDILQLDGWDPIAGTTDHYFAMLDFLENNDLSIQSNYEYIKTQMDVDNFIMYQVSQIYFDNTDWPGSNIKYWRERNADGKWRWFLFDTDFGFGLYEEGYLHNTLLFATEPNGPEWPNPPWSTFLLRKLLENEEFTDNFINRYADLLNSNFIADTVVNLINNMKSTIEEDIPRHLTRWGSSLSNWQSDVADLIEFAENRNAPLIQYYIDYFNLSGTSNVTLNTSPVDAGKIKINKLKVFSFPWIGIYFKYTRLPIKAIPNPGYRFVGWTGIANADSQTVTVILEGDINVTAIFEVDSGGSSSIVINEINYNAASDFDPEDWVELYNNYGSDIDVSGWIFKDENDIPFYYFPAGTIIPTGGYLIICRDTSAFKTYFPNVNHYIGDLGFGLSGSGELVRLYDSDMELVDAFTYNDEAPWPTEPDGNGPTLSLLNPDLDNALPESWGVSIEHGTPGTLNEFITSIEEQDNIIPTEYSLSQNYPNPFNPTTTIRFTIPTSPLNPSPYQGGRNRERFITLIVYDVLGNEIATLVNAEKPAGSYEVKFDATGLTSGIYFYQLLAGSFIQTKKMILLK